MTRSINDFKGGTVGHEFDEPAPEVYQEVSVPSGAIDVHVVRAVRTKELPAKSAGLQTYDLDALTPQRVLLNDARRGRSTMIGYSQNIQFGLSESQCRNLSTSFLWPNLLPLVWSNTSELWAMAATSTATLSVLYEMWD